jgi:chromosome segregation ATPase
MSDTQATRNGTAHAADLGTSAAFGIDEGLNEELQRLAAINRELLGGATTQAASEAADNALQAAIQQLAALNPEACQQEPRDTVYDFHDVAAGDEDDELASLRRENRELRAHLDALEQAMQSPAEAAEAAAPAAPTPEDILWASKQQEYEALLEEKSETIRTLHLQLHELQGSGASLSGVATLNQTRSLKKQLEDELAQVEKEEEELMTRMQQMEKAVSRDRAELARQRTELQKLHAELDQQIQTAAASRGRSRPE